MSEVEVADMEPDGRVSDITKEHDPANGSGEKRLP